VRVTVLCGLPKGDKADFIVQKCTEAGASEILFFLSHRCVAKMPSDREKKLTRWQRIAQESAKQSGRGIIPSVGLLEDIAEAFNKAQESGLGLFMYETGDRRTLKDALENAGEFSSAAILTGPEGGFEAFEAELAGIMGLNVCSMGPRIFRCETAPIAALSAVMYATGNM
jgi:16S rRNA (uracil1498-N3)-methyltransferase